MPQQCCECQAYIGATLGKKSMDGNEIIMYVG